MRFKVVEGAVLNRGGAVYAAGEEIEATGDDAKELLASGLVEQIDKPKK